MRMENFIRAMSDHWIKLLICLFVLGTQVHAYENIVNKTIVEGAVEKGAVCLDGTPPAYFFDKGFGEGADNWIVFLEGGAWCRNTTECARRSKEYLGSSAKMSNTSSNATFSMIRSSNGTENPDFYNWNRVDIVYCDGASFGGDVEEVDPKTKIYYRGARILPAVVDDLLAKGMKNAKNVILGGQSAGGLAVMLNCDRFRAKLPKSITRVKCFSDSGFFIQGKDIPGANEKTIKEPLDDIVETQGMDKILPKSCTSKMDAKSCVYPENFLGDIQTPLFIMNSAFDGYQTSTKVNAGASGLGDCSINVTVCTPHQIDLLKGFRESFLKALPKVDPSKIGMFIDSYNTHTAWDATVWSAPYSPKLKNKTRAEAFADWYFDRSYFREIDGREIPHNIFT